MCLGQEGALRNCGGNRPDRRRRSEEGGLAIPQTCALELLQAKNNNNQLQSSLS